MSNLFLVINSNIYFQNYISSDQLLEVQIFNIFPIVFTRQLKKIVV